ncbi:MAG: hypothetical protein JWQ50_4048 [Caballeronia mineralivorans]|jgi:chemotaxis response regulator CheB|nr:hypothetical protein [Caballeronia mineralivorans]MEA3102054.1 hypothetical protein [Caballeronia mineralivorans]
MKTPADSLDAIEAIVIGASAGGVEAQGAQPFRLG